MNTDLALPDLGLGLGLRSKHFNHILEQQPEVDWFEAISENFMDSHGRPRHVLKQIAERYPVVMHGVSMSIGSTDPLDFDYLRKLKILADEVKPAWISDHLCWTGVLTLNSHDLLPLPLNEESLAHVCERINKVQDYLERPLVIENPSTYASFKNSTIKEWDFLRMMTEETGCGLLLDVNNVYVSSFNNDFDPFEYLEGIPFDRVVQMHLAGHQNCGDYIIDTHDREVTGKVWHLFQRAWQKSGRTSVLLEWDGNIPDFDVYHNELLKAQQYMSADFDLTLAEETPVSSVMGVSNPVNVVAPGTGRLTLLMADSPEIPLENFQKWMQHMLLDPFQQTGLANQQLPTPFHNASLEDLVHHSGKLQARDHLAIYQRSYIARLRNCMSQQFSALEYALGEELFRAFADHYLSENPSKGYNLADLGAGFADYLEANRPDKGQEEKEDWPDFMIELAHFEFAVGVAFEEKADENYELATEESREEDLSLVPVCYLFQHRFPVRWFYSEFKNERNPELPFEKETYCVLLRHDYQLSLYDLQKEQYELLQYLKGGQRLSQAKDHFIQKHPDAKERFESVWPDWKRRWIKAKFFQTSK